MGLFPKPPTPQALAKPPNPAQEAINAEDPSLSLAGSTGSLINTATRGLRRRASTQRTSLIGGG